jgi:PTH1 family peptidyl-tRNA hydrolase
MKMIVGLGNPGKTYEKTRHNTGYMVMDEILRKVNAPALSRKFKAKVTTVAIGDEQVLLMKPETYMNLSGEAVAEAARFHKIEPKDILVIFDDMDLPIGKVRIPRVRVGIDKNPMIPAVDYVLGKVEKEKRALHQKAVEHAADAAIDFVVKPFLEVMNLYNKKVD